MKRLPLYDSGADIACTIDDAEKPGRIATLEQMRSDVMKVERAEHGLLLRFPIDGAIEERLRAFTVDEKRCCAFFGFAISKADDVLTLQWDAPPTAGAILDGLVAFFEGDEPATVLRGLL